MSAFPTMSSVPYIAPVSKAIRTKSIVKNFDDQTETVRQKWIYPKRNINLTYEKLSTSEMRTLWQFYISHAGQADPFSFFDTVSDTYTTEYVGVGDNSTVLFSLPSLSATSRTLYVDGSSQTEGVDWTFGAASGADGEDTCTFDTAPGSGAIITFTFTGYLKIRCRFNDDNLDYNTFYSLINDVGLKLRGILNS